MADLSLKEKLQPSLLDRLIDDASRVQRESRSQRIHSLTQHRASVLRDLEWLMNTDNAESVHDLTDFPNVAASVINYGMPGLAGRTLSAVDISDIENRLGDAIRLYEPRIIPDTVQVKATYSDQESSVNALVFEIKGDLWATPVPLKLFLRTNVDLETGDIRIQTVADF
ncbi:type VI secretion system baseplate subunit TssE [Aporhodopirellula aestuarii]|uniref:Type VI secretion system baseplate subunit TssE n=1 Tax=Aporhodopirellula aestuarii TaxID=2950107 RepID=A0ABT0TZ94_9BACT|nr:type VI secretion system baseplate subunit TssE [Aporhodopirellula aestuarii]MCM2369876.1 type VI secretion system baseplate subunit TssE [Aporhodopirellula aestuarii]